MPAPTAGPLCGGGRAPTLLPRRGHRFSSVDPGACSAAGAARRTAAPGRGRGSRSLPSVPPAARPGDRGGGSSGVAATTCYRLAAASSFRVSAVRAPRAQLRRARPGRGSRAEPSQLGLRTLAPASLALLSKLRAPRRPGQRGSGNGGRYSCQRLRSRRCAPAQQRA